MPRSGVKMTITPAQMRDHARKHIQGFDGMDRERAAHSFLDYMITTTEFRYSLAQMRAAAQGLRLGMSEGIR